MTDSFNLVVKKIGEGTFDVMSKETEPDQDWSNEGVDVPKGTKLTVRANPEEGWLMDYISSNGNPTFNKKVWSGVMPDSDMVIVVAFKEKPKAEKPKTEETKKTLVSIVYQGKGQIDVTALGMTNFKPGRPFEVKTGEMFSVMSTPNKGWELDRITGAATFLSNIIQPVKAEGENMILKVVFEKEGGTASHDEHACEPWYTKLMFWRKSDEAHTSSNHASATTAEKPHWLMALGMIAIAFVAFVGYLIHSGPGKEAGEQYNAQKTQERCLDAVEKGYLLAGCGITTVPHPAQSAQPVVGGVQSSCPAIQVGRLTVYDGTARKGCTVTIQDDSQARLKGTFAITNLKDHPFGAFVNVECDSYEHRGATATFVKTGDRNGHQCVVLGKPSDAPTTATITVTSL